MMKRLRRLLKGQEGLSLIELLVVVAIMGVLATLTAVAVTGTTTSSKGATRTSDQDVVTNGEKAYSGEHPQGRHPTLDGCLSKKLFKKLTLTCGSGGAGAQEFTVDETKVGVDVDLNGVATDTAVKVVPILWDQFFGTGDTKKEFTRFVDLPKHAFDMISNSTGDNFWKTGKTFARPEDGVAIRSPFGSTGDHAACASLTTGDLANCPVWVLNEFGDAVALIPDSRY